MGSDDLFKKRKRQKLERLRRPSPSRDQKPRVLIVCQGSKTEPVYLNDFCSSEGLFPPNVIIDNKGGGLSPAKLVEYAIEKYTKEPDFNFVFIVFDKDTFTDYDRALDLIRRSPLQEGTKLIPINSVPCIEYWFLLHFKYTCSPFVQQRKRSPGAVVLRELKNHIPDYNKGMTGISTRILDKTDTAIKNSINSLKSAEQTGTDNPTTQMHILIVRLREIKEKL